MSKIYNMIETHVYKGAPEQEDNVVVETQLNLKIKYTFNAVDKESENAFLNHMTSNGRKNIIDIIYGSYVNELQEINAMLWKNDERDDISQKINKMIESMQGSE